MLPLFLIVHIFLGSTLAGTAVIAVLTMGHSSGRALVIAALIGLLASVPASWAVAKRLWAMNQ